MTAEAKANDLERRLDDLDKNDPSRGVLAGKLYVERQRALRAWARATKRRTAA